MHFLKYLMYQTGYLHHSSNDSVLRHNRINKVINFNRTKDQSSIITDLSFLCKKATNNLSIMIISVIHIELKL